MGVADACSLPSPSIGLGQRQDEEVRGGESDRAGSGHPASPLHVMAKSMNVVFGQVDVELLVCGGTGVRRSRWSCWKTRGSKCIRASHASDATVTVGDCLRETGADAAEPPEPSAQERTWRKWRCRNAGCHRCVEVCATADIEKKPGQSTVHHSPQRIVDGHFVERGEGPGSVFSVSVMGRTRLRVAD
jgi:hypothetical protein